jgi:hypothetical protein
LTLAELIDLTGLDEIALREWGNLKIRIGKTIYDARLIFNHGPVTVWIFKSKGGAQLFRRLKNLKESDISRGIGGT